MAITEKPLLDSNIPLSQGELNETFRFDIGNHVINSPDTNLGTVVDDRLIGILRPNVELRELRVEDPFVLKDPDGNKLVRDYVRRIEGVVRAHGYDPILERIKGDPYRDDSGDSFTNRFTQAWLADPEVAALKIWHSIVPSAMALGYLSNPWVNSLITDITGENSYPCTPETALQLTHVADAVGIRNRRAALEYIAKGHIGSVVAANSIRGDKLNIEELDWLSFASGTGEPSLDASKAIMESLGVKINLYGTDFNPAALEFFKKYSEQIGFKGDFSTHLVNLMDPNFIEKIRKKTGLTDGVIVGEDAGWREYLPEKGDKFGLYEGSSLIAASDYTRILMDVIDREDGAYFTGNMVVDRPQRDFVFGIVNWPVINARSDEEFIRTFDRAGVLDDPSNKLTVYRVADDINNDVVYNLAKLTRHVRKFR